MSTARQAKRTTIAPLVAALAVVLVSVAAVASFVLGRRDADASAPGGVDSSPKAPATRSLVPADCPATFDALAEAGERARRSEFVPAGAEGATLCRYFEPNEAGVIPLLDAHQLAGDPEELVGYLNGLQGFPAQIESPDPADGIPAQACVAILTHTFHIVLHYSDSVNILVTVNPPCRWVKSDGDTRVLYGVGPLLHHWGLTA